ncbi:hypothetical protein [Rhizobium sp. AG855]|uniref:hypothetical protein n=1 Tax=Rhizobium sp. AG855 TaxID=2183898 RepID=UPI000FF5FF66|nr:hypothetical protein [Rhizobium sp. AG855]RKE76936.1 hypothetical protein DFO46_4683 [Rhizobium sp. AG855]
MKKFGNLAAAALVLGAAFSTTAFANSFSTTGNQPSISQSNWDFNAAPIAALSGTPATAKITNVSFSWGYRTPSYNPNNPTPYTLRATICVAGLCGQTTSTSESGETYWAGKPATSSWNFTFRAVSPQTKTFVGGLSPNGQIRLTVNYDN